MKLGIVLVLTLLFGTPAVAETLLVGLPEPGRVPFFWFEEGKGFQGSYVRLLNRIAEKAGFEVKYELLPQARLIVRFNEGAVDIEPGVSPSWRPSEQDAALSRYTRPFTTMDDVLIYRKGQALPLVHMVDDLTRLQGLKVGQVRGFWLPTGLEAVLCLDEYDIARRVTYGTLEVGLLNASVADWLLTHFKVAYDRTKPYATTPVSFRLHVSKAHWVEVLDRVLNELEKSGELTVLLATDRS